MSEYFEHIIVGPNVSCVCQLCGATITDWCRTGGEDTARQTDDGWLRPNQIKHLAWHRLINRRLSQGENAAAMFRPLGG